MKVRDEFLLEFLEEEFESPTEQTFQDAKHTTVF